MRRTQRETVGTRCRSFIEERRLLLATLELFSDGELSYRPVGSAPDDSLCVREILQHLADADRRLVESAVRGRVAPLPMYVCDESASHLGALDAGTETVAELRSLLEQSWRAVEGILAWPAEAASRRLGPEEHVTLNDLIGAALSHAAQHRGQLWTYLELLGKKPPRDPAPPSQAGA